MMFLRGDAPARLIKRISCGSSSLNKAHDASGGWGYSKYWILVNDPLEVAEWCSVVDRKEGACAGRELEISTQDRRALTVEFLQ